MLPKGMLRTAILLAALVSAQALADSRNLAPGFAKLPKGSSVILMPVDVELFSISAGGVPEPRADWTEIANGHIDAALRKQSTGLGLHTKKLSDKDADELAEINGLHTAVARSIELHHLGIGTFALPTKNGQLDWSLGEAVQPIKQRSGADYALFIRMRDSYASAERKVAMVAMALLGVGIPGGAQTGFASLVNLNTGQVMWFNRLARGTGDLREEEPADETVKALLTDFPRPE